jgi:hypothetical protein
MAAFTVDEEIGDCDKTERVLGGRHVFGQTPFICTTQESINKYCTDVRQREFVTGNRVKASQVRLK